LQKFIKTPLNFLIRMASAFFAEARIPASHDLRTRILFDICRRGGEVVIAELVKEYGGGDSTKGKYVYQIYSRTG